MQKERKTLIFLSLSLSCALQPTTYDLRPKTLTVNDEWIGE